MKNTGLTKENNEAAWLEERKYGLGGSDCAGIITFLSAPADRVGSYEKSMLDMWAGKTAKRGDTPPAPEPRQSSAKVLARGHHLEEFVIRQYELEHGIDPSERLDVGLSWHDDYKRIFATPDQVYTDRGLEAKTRRYSTGWGPSASEVFPLDVEVQCRVYMEVLDYDRWDIACAISLDEIRFYYLERDKDLGRQILDTCTEWFEKHVVKGLPPDPDERQETTDAIQRMYRNPKPKLREPTKEELELVKEYIAAKKVYKRAKAQKDRLENRLKLAIADNEGIKGIARWSEVKPRPTFSSSEFAEASPKMYEKMLKKYPKVRKPYRKFTPLFEDET